MTTAASATIKKKAESPLAVDVGGVGARELDRTFMTLLLRTPLVLDAATRIAVAATDVATHPPATPVVLVVRDAPRADRVLEIVLGVHRPRVDESAPLVADDALRVGCCNAPGIDGVRVIPECRERVGGVHGPG